MSKLELIQEVFVLEEFRRGQWDITAVFDSREALQAFPGSCGGGHKVPLYRLKRMELPSDTRSSTARQYGFE